MIVEQMSHKEWLQSAVDRSGEVAHVRGWSRDWDHAGTYLHLEVSEFIESLRGKGKHPPTKEAAHILFVLFSTMAEHDVSISEVMKILNQGLYDGWKLVEEEIASKEADVPHVS
jgi:hypothetical protein